MPRGDQVPKQQPLGRISKIDRQNRVRLPSGHFLELLSWLKGKADAERIALAGPRGGLILEDPERVRLALSHLDAASLTGRQAAEALADYARFLALRWPVELRRDREGRYSLNLPEEARKAGLIPLEGHVAVLVIGTNLEIWGTEALKQRPRAPREAYEYTVESILEELGEES